MGNTAESLTFSRVDYLKWEAEQPDKHEYLAGEVFAMTGVRQNHSIVAGNIFAFLHQKLKGGPCKPHFSDMKLHIDIADAFFYPDIMVSCDRRDAVADLFLEHPSLIIEVLSESTAKYDMGLKFEYYRMIPELKEYVLVDPERHKIWLYRKNSRNEWVLHDFRDSQEILFKSVGCTLSINDIFEGVIV